LEKEFKVEQANLFSSMFCCGRQATIGSKKWEVILNCESRDGAWPVNSFSIDSTEENITLFP